MITSSLVKLFAYNEWAWERVFVQLAQVPEADYKAQRPFFWDSIHGLTVHCYAADWIWWQRLHGDSPSSLPSVNSFATFAELRETWDPQRAKWTSFVQEQSESSLGQRHQFQNTQSDAYTLSTTEILQHLMIHATEHRSQLTPVLYQLGYATQPLDYAYFARRAPSQ